MLCSVLDEMLRSVFGTQLGTQYAFISTHNIIIATYQLFTIVQ